jgi:integrase
MRKVGTFLDTAYAAKQVSKEFGRLTEGQLRALRLPVKDYKLSDGGGLYLYVMVKGYRWWRYLFRFDGRPRQLSLGVYPQVSLKEARERRDEARRLVAQGIDPIRHRRSAERKRLSTFEDVATEWLTERTGTWSAEYAQNVQRMFRLNIFPWIGTIPVAALHAADVLECLKRVQKRGALETAHRIRANCSMVMRYAVATRRADRNPIVDLQGALPPVRTRHHPSITEPVKIAALLRAIHGYRSKSVVVGAALRFAPLVFVRPGELRGADWSEFDLDEAEWRIPAERMKMRVQHIVPLSRQSVEILRDLKNFSGPNGLAFPSIRTFIVPMSENTVNAALRKLGYTSEEMTGHGFRSMASTLLNEWGWNRDAIERQLAHSEQNGVRAAYNYAEHLPLRRKMMQAWADYLDALRISGKPVKFPAVPLR